MSAESKRGDGNLSTLAGETHSRGDALTPRVEGEVIKGQHGTYIRLYRENNHRRTRRTIPVVDGLFHLGERIKHG